MQVIDVLSSGVGEGLGELVGDDDGVGDAAGVEVSGGGGLAHPARATSSNTTAR